MKYLQLLLLLFFAFSCSTNREKISSTSGSKEISTSDSYTAPTEAPVTSPVPPLPKIPALEGSGAPVSDVEIYTDDISAPAPEGAYLEEISIKSSESKSKLKSSRTKKPVTVGSIEKDFKSVKAGILTAGELNDFSKWNLWTDVSSEKLKEHHGIWKIWPKSRYSVQVTNTKGKPVIDAKVELLNDKTIIWEGKTDNTGKAELWAFPYDTTLSTKNTNYTFRINHGGQVKTAAAKPFSSAGVNLVTMPISCNISNNADAVFVVDATGSMGDEIVYLQAEMESIITKVKSANPQLNLRLGSVFYRDKGDDYETVKSPLSANEQQTIAFMQKQYAGGGGDYPEAVTEALRVAINEMDWSTDARSRLIFLVLDAPPHQHTWQQLHQQIALAAKKGIRIIPIGASGIDKSTEYLMRSMAMATNGTYVFLTNHSGVGNAHIEPTTDSYKVELLNDLLVRLFGQYLYAPDCNEPMAKMKPDTLYLIKPITTVILDSSQIQQSIIVSRDTLNQNPYLPVIPEPNEVSLKCYPNPTRGPVTIEIKGNVKEVFMADMNGKLVSRYPVDNHLLKLNISQFPAGTYFIQCEADGKRLSGKIVLLR